MITLQGNTKNIIEIMATYWQQKITMPKISSYFSGKDLKALGIGCFGPIDLDRSSPSYGSITTTPKISWRNFNIVGCLKDALHIPIGFDTDVNAAALGEAFYGITKGLDSSIYITIGTGIGVGVYMNGQLLHGVIAHLN